MKKTLTILLIGILGIIVTWAIFAVAFVWGWGLTDTSPPLKQYKYIGTVARLMFKLENFTSTHPRYKCKRIDTVGASTSKHAYYVTLEMKSNQTDITFEVEMKEKKETKFVSTNVDLIMAFDEVNKTGGYLLHIKGIQALITCFDQNVIKPLNAYEETAIVISK